MTNPNDPELALRYLLAAVLSAWPDYSESDYVDVAETVAVELGTHMLHAKDGTHRGDCTNEPQMCLRCWHDRMLGEVDALIKRFSEYTPPQYQEVRHEDRS